MQLTYSPFVLQYKTVGLSQWQIPSIQRVWPTWSELPGLPLFRGRKTHGVSSRSQHVYHCSHTCQMVRCAGSIVLRTKDWGAAIFGLLGLHLWMQQGLGQPTGDLWCVWRPEGGPVWSISCSCKHRWKDRRGRMLVSSYCRWIVAHWIISYLPSHSFHIGIFNFLSHH